MWSPSQFPIPILFPPPVSLMRGAPWSDTVFSTRWSEGPDGYDLSIDLAGFRRRDVSLEVRGDVLEIRAERARGFWSKEHRAIHQAVTLPAGADADAVQASFRGGRLTVRVPKRPEARARTIPIAVARRPTRSS